MTVDKITLTKLCQGLRVLTTTQQREQLLQCVNEILCTYEAHKYTICSQEIAQSMYAMQNCDFDLQHNSESPTAARSMLALLSAQMKNSVAAPFTSQEVSNALFGLQNLSNQNKDPLASEVLTALTWKLRECSDPLSGQAVSMSLCGLR